GVEIESDGPFRHGTKGYKFRLIELERRRECNAVGGLLECQSSSHLAARRVGRDIANRQLAGNECELHLAIPRREIAAQLKRPETQLDIGLRAAQCVEIEKSVRPDRPCFETRRAIGGGRKGQRGRVFKTKRKEALN